MEKTTSIAGALMADESGVTAIEYGLLAALLAVAIIAGVGATAEGLGDVYDKWTSAVLAAIAGP